MAKLTILFGFLGLCWRVRGEGNKYDNYTLLKTHTEQHLAALAASATVPQRSPAPHDSTAGRESPAHAAPEDLARGNGRPEDYKHNHSRYFDSPVDRHISRSGFNLYDYNSLKTIKEYINEVAAMAPELVKVDWTRTIALVKISKNHHANNPIIFIDAGIHGHEWVAPSMALYIIHRLTTDFDARARQLEGVDWYIMPLVNPDGYEYTRSDRKNRIWKKSVHPTPHKKCRGLDLNKNFGYNWGVSGSSHDECDMDYCGSAAFCVWETQTVRDVMLANKGRMKMYVALHAYGNYLLYPWGYTKRVKVEKWKRLRNLAVMASDAVQKAGGRPFRVASAGSRFLYSGSSDDYAYGEVHVPYVYRMKLTDGFEFTFPAELLQTVLPQYFEAFKVFAKQIYGEFKIRG